MLSTIRRIPSELSNGCSPAAVCELRLEEAQGRWGSEMITLLRVGPLKLLMKAQVEDTENGVSRKSVFPC